jgi:flavin reductase (DIM6/NTAB) family NADH-FMN oxidoreductase RutF
MKNFVFLALSACLLIACNNQNAKKQEEKPSSETFGKNFVKIEAGDFNENVFNLVGKDNIVITGGKINDYNSMVAGWGGWGIYFGEPTTWCMLRANRYTLEYIRRDSVYSLCFFDEQYREKFMIFGTSSGRNGSKMKEHKLTPLQMPNGSIAYEEAKIVIECKLSQVTTVSPSDFAEADMKKFIDDAYIEAGEYHKLVFGKITGIWIKK